MILSTLHKTTGTTHDLYSLRETIDFFPFINLKMLCLFPVDPLYLLVSITKQLLKVIPMKTFEVLIHYTEFREAHRFWLRTQILSWLKKIFFYYLSGPQGEISSLDRAYSLSNWNINQVLEKSEKWRSTSL